MTGIYARQPFWKQISVIAYQRQDRDIFHTEDNSWEKEEFIKGYKSMKLKPDSETPDPTNTNSNETR
jgi:hypothetical protein